VEVVVCSVSIPPSVEVIVVELWLSALPLVQRLYYWKGVVYSRFLLPKSSVEVPCVGSPVWTL